uniref:Uncharacterized protein n=1 Tax=Anguilla anguilla TaxID=7936 RepID=A0A0E9R9R8_ANGAN
MVLDALFQIYDWSLIKQIVLINTNQC